MNLNIAYDNDTKTTLNLVGDVWATRSKGDVLEVMSKAASVFGYQGFLYAPQRLIGDTLCQSETYNNWPEEWRDEYAAQNFGSCDPHPSLLRHARCPYFWDKDLQTSSSYKYLAARSAAYGIASGIMIPARMNGRRMASLSFHTGSAQASWSSKSVVPLQLIAEALTHKYPGGRSTPASNPKLAMLSDNQVEILKWIHMGKTNWEISVITAISYRTINYHVSEILRKLDVDNRMQAAALYTQLIRDQCVFEDAS